MKDDIHLQAGETYFGKAPSRVRTLLGSCVAVSVWHDRLKVGGLCHYLIAKREDKQPTTLDNNSYKYGDNALNFLTEQMQAIAPRHEFKLGLFGGSNMYNTMSVPSIGESNVAFARNWACEKLLTFEYEDVLGDVCRTLILDLSSGNVSIKRYRQENCELS